uniref:2Fe-2S iron-sulfur cluster-binding protein n=1 Tax=Rhodoferax sp. GW822-FHT02A01 TaxID=3141537 RepID=UPI00406BFEE4
MTPSSPHVLVNVNGRYITVAHGTTVAAALALAACGAARTSVSGEPRAPVCGMGICQECRVRVDGNVRLACQTLCAQGMLVEPMA